MLWMGVKRPLCPICRSFRYMRRIDLDGREYWECRDCKRKYPIRDGINKI